jgi:CheY-like chemotaxis protein
MNHILVIDDEKDILELLSDTLRYFGYEVKAAHDGERGVELLSKGHSFDLVITDIDMPGMNGNEVAKYIRRSDKPDTPIVAITGASKDIERELFNHLLRKPFDLQAFVDVVKSLA